MRIELETIPVWDSIHNDSECFLCSLMREAEFDVVSYYLGSSVMHPETRVKVNELGFCPHHWEALADAGKPHSLALIGHTYLQQTENILDPAVKRITKAKPGKKTTLSVDQLLEAIHKREQGCLICLGMERRLVRYANTTVFLWEDDAEFRKELLNSKGVCLHHMETLLAVAQTFLEPDKYHTFATELTQLVLDNLKRVEDDVWWMTQKYKAEHTNSPWNGCEDAHKRLVRKLIGEGRIVSGS